MNTKLVEDIANAVLYEGYMLYPYRASALKNQKRWNFGVVYPRAYAQAGSGSDACSMQTEVLAVRTGFVQPVCEIRVRFLRLLATGAATECDVVVPPLDLTDVAGCPVDHKFAFPPIEGSIAVIVEALTPDLLRIRVRILNESSFTGSAREAALAHSLVSTHTILNLSGGGFISLLDPPETLREVAAQCENTGTWPVLVGAHGERDAMLSSPIILYDYPRIAPESPGALFDGTEIDEILTLRIMTLTDQEKLEMGQDDRTREILERTCSMPQEQLMKLHGALRGADGSAMQPGPRSTR